jgi:hypothetical protein
LIVRLWNSWQNCWISQTGSVFGKGMEPAEVKRIL